MRGIGALDLVSSYVSAVVGFLWGYVSEYVRACSMEILRG